MLSGVLLFARRDAKLVKEGEAERQGELVVVSCLRFMPLPAKLATHLATGLQSAEPSREHRGARRAKGAWVGHRNNAPDVAPGRHHD